MDTQHGSDVQDHEQHLSGELHLPQDANTKTQRIDDASAQPNTPDAQPQPSSQKQGDDSNQNIFYYDDESLDDKHFDEDEGDDFGSVLSTPFQMSEEMPPVQTASGKFAQQGPTPPPTTGTRSPRKFPVVHVLILAAVIVLVITTGAMALAQSSPATLPVRTTTTGYNSMGGQQAKPTPKPQPIQGKGNAPTPKPTTPPISGQGSTAGLNGGSGTWLPQQLPAGWTDAGLATGDALFAERTAAAFTDREMSLDYRSVGTRAHHGGTFTAATFVLTANAKARFAQNDVRLINNALFDRVQQERLIQSVVNAHPQLMQFATNGQQRMAWVDVSFQLWQSKIDANGARTEGFDIDAATNQPRTHHMMALLLRVPQDAQGANPAMGGTGWLVSNYAFDLPAGTMLDSVQPA